MRLRSWGAAAAAALIAPLLAAAPAQAWVDYAPPVFVSPTNGAGPLVGTVDVSVTSDAPAVLVQIETGWWPSHTELVTMTGGAGSFAWPTAGFDDPTLTAYPCQTADTSQCGGQWSQVQVTVDNAVDGFDAPTTPVSHAPAYDPPLTVLVTDDNPGGDLFVLHAGPYVRVATATAGVPTELAFSASPYDTVQSGPLRMIRCSTWDTLFCDVASADSANVTVRRGLSVNLYTGTGGLISPNGDGLGETLPMDFWIEPGVADLAATWTVTDLAGTELLPAPVPIDVSGIAGGTRVDFLLDPFPQGVTLTDGDYRAKLVVTGTLDGHSFTGTSTSAFTVDTTAPEMTSAAPTVPTFYPEYDKWAKQYLNEAVFTVDRTGPFPYTSRADVLDAAGTVVLRNIDYGWWTAGKVVWNGRNGNGKLLPEGDYHLRLTARDYVGNQTVVESSPITLSHDAYRSLTWKKTVTDQASLFADWSGKCGLLRKPGLKGGKGSLGYYSNGRCRTTDVAKGVAAAAHRVILPAADKYSTVKFRVNSGPVDKYNRAGFLTISNQDKALGSLQALDASWGWHLNVKRKAADMVWANRAIYWMVNCAYGQRYDVAKVEVTLSYVRWSGPAGTAPYSRVAQRPSGQISSAALRPNTPRAVSQR